jgi:trk system potassium uptake protein TrkA
VRLIVVDGGPLGRTLIGLAVEREHDVTVIEPDKDTAESVAASHDVRVLRGSIGDGGIMDEAEAAHADALVATTDDDSANLMAIVLGLEAGIGTLVAVVNDRHHRVLFERLGAHVLVDPDVIVAQHLWGMVARPEVEDAVALPGGGLASQVTLGGESGLVGRTITELREQGLVDRELAVVWLRRDGETILPGDDEARLQAGDVLTVVSPEPMRDGQLAVFRGGG